MIALTLTDVKTFMNQLLRKEIFDDFLLLEATLTQDATIVIDGHLSDSYYTEDELQQQHLSEGSVLPFHQLKPLCYQLIVGKKTPVYFKFTFLLPDDLLLPLLEELALGFTSKDVSGLFIHLTFKHNQLMITTGISYKNFIPSHSLDEQWDRYVKNFLQKNSIFYEEI